MKVFRYILFPIALIYGGITLFRNFLYKKNIFKSSEFDLPIICIGNLSMGGTGKTPHTEYLARLLKDEYKIFFCQENEKIPLMFTCYKTTKS